MCHNPSAIASGAHTFSHKVSREVALKKVLVLKGVVQLAVRHAATLKPAVKHLLHPVQLTLALLAGDGDVVYEVPVQVCHLQPHVACHQVQQQRVLIDLMLHALSVCLLLLLEFMVRSTECLCGPVTKGW